MPKGVAETIPKPPLGVVLTTPLAPWGWLGAQGGGQGVAIGTPSFFFFFFEKYVFLFFF
jgi:hypothetical protein